MAIRNPFNEEAQPREQQGTEEYSAINSGRVIRIHMPDGSIREVPIESHISRPGPDGTYVDMEIVDVIHDAAGNPMVINDPRQVALSHSGLFITSPEQAGVCTSRLHPNGVSRNILVGQDGQVVGNGGVCSRCMARKNHIQIVLGVLGLGVLIGTYKALGWF